MNPVLFSLGPLTIYWYGVFVAAASLAAILTAALRARRYGLNIEAVYDISIYAIVGAIAGSRILYVIENPAEFASSPGEIFMIWRGGLSYHGGLMGAVMAGVVFLKVRRLSVGDYFDLLVPSVALGHAIGRIGCLLNGCCFGKVTSLPWGIVFPAGSLAFAHQQELMGFPPGGWSLPVHPTQVYESLLELGIFVALSISLPRKRFSGQIFLLYLALYGLGRFFIEFARADNPAVARAFGMVFSEPQIMGALLFIIAGAVVLIGGRRRRGC